MKTNWHMVSRSGVAWVLMCVLAIGVACFMIDASHVWECGCDRVVTRVVGHVCGRAVASGGTHAWETRGNCVR